MSWESKRKSGVRCDRRGTLTGGPVDLNRRSSGRVWVEDALAIVTTLGSDWVLASGLASTSNAIDTAQSSQDEQYFSGVCVSLWLDLTSTVV
jgi:hypothetical protein